MSWAHQRVVQKRMNRSKCRCEEDCCTSVGTSCTTNAEVIELEHYGQMACGKPYAPIHDAWLYIRWDAYEIPAWRPCDIMSNYFDHMLYFVTTFTHTFNGPFSGWAGTRKVKPIWILLKQETVSGSGISWAICKFAPCSRQIIMRMPFLPPYQQRQSTEGISTERMTTFSRAFGLYRLKLMDTVNYILCTVSKFGEHSFCCCGPGIVTDGNTPWKLLKSALFDCARQ